MLNALTILSGILAAVHAEFSVLEKRENPPDGFSLIGATPLDKFLNLRLSLTQNDISGLHDAIHQVSTPGSPRYGQYLSKGEVNHSPTPQ
jgi:tripeptidyl-peptidase-1